MSLPASCPVRTRILLIWGSSTESFPSGFLGITSSNKRACVSIYADFNYAIPVRKARYPGSLYKWTARFLCHTIYNPMGGKKKKSSPLSSTHTVRGWLFSTTKIISKMTVRGYQVSNPEAPPPFFFFAKKRSLVNVYIIFSKADLTNIVLQNSTPILLLLLLLRHFCFSHTLNRKLSIRKAKTSCEYTHHYLLLLWLGWFHISLSKEQCSWEEKESSNKRQAPSEISTDGHDYFCQLAKTKWWLHCCNHFSNTKVKQVQTVTYSMSKTVPSGVQTGYSNGCRDKLGKKVHILFSKISQKSWWQK